MYRNLPLERYLRQTRRHIIVGRRGEEHFESPGDEELVGLMSLTGNVHVQPLFEMPVARPGETTLYCLSDDLALFELKTDILTWQP
jgi:hypothetical protein